MISTSRGLCNRKTHSHACEWGSRSDRCLEGTALAFETLTTNGACSDGSVSMVLSVRIVLFLFLPLAEHVLMLFEQFGTENNLVLKRLWQGLEF